MVVCLLLLLPALLGQSDRPLAPDFHWVRTGFNGAGSLWQDFAVDSEGHAYLLFNAQVGASVFGERIDGEHGRAIIVKLDREGDLLEVIDPKLYVGGRTIALDPDGNILVAGEVNGHNGPTFELEGQVYELNGANRFDQPSRDAYVMKLRPSGELQWFRHFGGASDRIYGDSVLDVAVDSDGHVAVVGYWRGSGGRFGGGFVSAGGESDAFVAHLGPGGEMRWIHAFGTPNDGGNLSTFGRGDLATCVAIDEDGNVFAGGNFKGNVPIGNKIVTSRPVPNELPVKYTTDGFVVKFSRNGRVLWADAIGGETSADSVVDLAIGLDGEVLVTGIFKGELRQGHGDLISQPGGEFDIYIVNYSSSGEPLLALKLGAEKRERPRSIAVDGKGRIYLFAETGYLEFDDVFVLPLGNLGGSMFCFDRTGRGLWGVAGLSNVGEAILIPDSTGSRMLAQAYLPTGETVLKGYSGDFPIKQEGPGAGMLLSIEGAPWENADSSSGPYHPADLNSDWRLDINEVTGYGRAWKTGALWENEPNPVPINYVTRAGAIWKNGEQYRWDGTVGEAPNAWVNQ